MAWARGLALPPSAGSQDSTPPSISGAKYWGDYGATVTPPPHRPTFLSWPQDPSQWGWGHGGGFGSCKWPSEVLSARASHGEAACSQRLVLLGWHNPSAFLCPSRGQEGKPSVGKGIQVGEMAGADRCLGRGLRSTVWTWHLDSAAGGQTMGRGLLQQPQGLHGVARDS